MYGDGVGRSRGGPGLFSSDKSRSPSNSPPLPTMRRGPMANAQRRLPPTPKKPSTLGVGGPAQPQQSLPQQQQQQQQPSLPGGPGAAAIRGGGRGGGVIAPTAVHGVGVGSGLMPTPTMGRGGVGVGGIMPKSPSASHLLSGSSPAVTGINNNINMTSSNLPSSSGFQQLGGPMSIGATSLMNLPKVNASPSSHFNDRLQRSGAPLPPGGGDIVGTPGGRALPIPPGQQQPQTMLP